MMKTYTNPIPDLDDEPQSRSITIKFFFKEPVTRSEAAENLNEWFQHNQVIPEMIMLTGNVGIYYKQTQSRLGVEDRDPKGYGPRN